MAGGFGAVQGHGHGPSLGVVGLQISGAFGYGAGPMRRLALLGMLCAVAVAIPLFAGAPSASANRAACEEEEWVNAPDPATSCWEEVHAEEKATAHREAEEKAEGKPWWERCNELRPDLIEACFYEHNGETEPTEAEGEREADREIEAAKRERIRERERHAREWEHKPTVTLRTARYQARRFMHETDYSVWTLSCGGGRINRTHWRCGVKLYYPCESGRIRVTGAGFKDHQAWFRARGSELRPCTHD